MGRPTIRDVAEAANVSTSTVKRVLGGSDAVRRETMSQVLEAAERLGFYGVGAIRERVRTNRPGVRIAVLLQQRNRSFYRAIAASLEQVAKAVERAQVDLRIEFMDDLAPDLVAKQMEAMGAKADALAVVAAEHPLVTKAIVNLSGKGVRTYALISPLTAPCGVGFVGIDSWKVGRSSAWFFARCCPRPGRIGILVGNHRYRSQELNEAGFRSYFREHAPDFQLLEPLSTFESGTIARELTERLLDQEPNLIGLFISGGGIAGAISALRDSGRSAEITAVTYELTEQTQAALLDGTLTAVISHPLDRMAMQVIDLMIADRENAPGEGMRSVLLPFEIHMSESL